MEIKLSGDVIIGSCLESKRGGFYFFFFTFYCLEIDCSLVSQIKNPEQLVGFSQYLPVPHMQIMNKRKGTKEPGRDGGEGALGLRETRPGYPGSPAAARPGRVRGAAGRALFWETISRRALMRVSVSPVGLSPDR